MEKDKIIEQILNDWAMHSPDGLAEDYNSEENMAALEEVMLMEYGLTGAEFDHIFENILEAKPKGSINKKYIVKNEKGEDVIGGKYPHYKYPPGTKISDIVAVMSGKSKKKLPTIAKYNEKQATKDLSDEERAKRIKQDKYEDFAASNGKRAGAFAARWMRKAIDDGGAAGKEFLNMYDSLTRDQAIDIYNDPRYAKVINGVEGTGKEKKGLGRGELVFVWLMKGYKSGGTREVDLVFGSIDKDIEMKELTGKRKEALVNISAPTLKGYYNTGFRLGIDELATEIRKSGNKGLDPENNETFSFEKNPCLATFLVHVLENYPGEEGGDRTKMARSLKNFCTLLRTTEMPSSLFNALSTIGSKLQNAGGSLGSISSLDANKETAKAVVVVGGEKQEFKVDPADARDELTKISANQKTTLDLDVKSGKASDEKTEKDYLGEAKNLLYFKNRYTVTKITKEISELLKRKYSGLIVIDKRGGVNKARFVPADAKFTFVNLGLNKVNLALPGEDAGDGD